MIKFLSSYRFDTKKTNKSSNPKMKVMILFMALAFSVNLREAGTFLHYPLRSPKATTLRQAGVRVGWRLVALSGDDGEDADDASTWQSRLKVVESGNKVGA